jgi:hypothetical protein
MATSSITANFAIRDEKEAKAFISALLSESRSMVPPARKRNWKPVGSVKTSAKDMIGFGKRFHAPIPTEEWMKELREGEEE